MTIYTTLHILITAAWTINLYCLGRSFIKWSGTSEEKKKVFVLAGTAAVVFLAISSFVAVRGGYDNNHDYMCLANNFFTKDSFVLFSFKEISPLFTDAVNNLIFNNSLQAIIWKNRALFVLSSFIFFAGLRQIDISITVSSAAVCLFFMNFLSFMNSSAFSTTASDLFIIMCGMASLSSAHSSDKIRPLNLLWIFSSLTLIMTARYEFVPVFVMCAAATAFFRYKKGDRFFSGLPAKIIITAGTLLSSGLLAVLVKQTPPVRQLIRQNTLAGYFYSLYYQLAENNFNLLFSQNHMAGAAGLCLAVLSVLVVIGAVSRYIADKENRVLLAAEAGVLSVWALYFIFIFQPLGEYPFQFMRHQLFFLIPFMYIAAYGLEGYHKLFSKHRLAFIFTAVSAVIIYIPANAKTAISYNNSLRTNDIELNFLKESQKNIPREAVIFYPRTDTNDFHYEFIKKFFNADICGRTDVRNAMIYISTEQLFIHDKKPAGHGYTGPGRPENAWKKLDFIHKFYTTNANERKDEPETTIGFYRIEGNGEAEAQFHVKKGACELKAGNFAAAKDNFIKAARENAGCEPCLFLGAVSAASDKDRATAAEFADLIKTEEIREKTGEALSSFEKAEKKSKEWRNRQFGYTVNANAESVFFNY